MAHYEAKIITRLQLQLKPDLQHSETKRLNFQQRAIGTTKTVVISRGLRVRLFFRLKSNVHRRISVLDFAAVQCCCCCCCCCWSRCWCLMFSFVLSAVVAGFVAAGSSVKAFDDASKDRRIHRSGSEKNIRSVFLADPILFLWGLNNHCQLLSVTLVHQ